MEDKYPRKSEFANAYIDTKIFHYLNIPNTYKISKASKVYLDCINLEKVTMTLSNCDKAKSIVENYYRSNPKLKLIKNNIMENCSEKFYKLYIASNLEKGSSLGKILNYDILTSENNLFMKCLEKATSRSYVH